MNAVVVDTHPLVWYFTEDPRLSARAREFLEQAEAGAVQALVPTIVLAEIAHISERKKAPVSVHEVVTTLRQENGFAVVPFDFEVFSTMLKLPAEWELHDRVIAATARYYSASLLTKDGDLRKSEGVETIW